MTDAGWPPWRDAWQAALYGPGGFYLGDGGPAAHFRTASHAAPVPLARSLARLARRNGCTRVIDLGAGRGELASALATVAPDLAVTAVDLVTRPEALPEPVTWLPGDAVEVLATLRPVDALVVAWELLDVVPCTVVELDDASRPRAVLVDPRTGRERLGDPPAPDELDWIRRWWPLEAGEPGDRVEVGLSRDTFWAGLVRAVRGGVLLAVDYGHGRTARPPLGSLAGFRAGRQTPPVPDARADLTAHVALDAVRAAGEAAGAVTLADTDQRSALLDLGLLLGTPGSGELLDPGGLGGFGWLLQRVG